MFKQYRVEGEVSARAQNQTERGGRLMQSGGHSSLRKEVFKRVLLLSLWNSTDVPPSVEIVLRRTQMDSACNPRGFSTGSSTRTAKQPLSVLG